MDWREYLLPCGYCLLGLHDECVGARSWCPCLDCVLQPGSVVLPVQDDGSGDPPA